MNARSDAAPNTPPRLLPIVYCYSGARWNNSFPGRQFALMREMAAHTPVFFLNDPVIKGYVAEFRLPTAERICEGLTVIHNAFTFRASRSGKHLGPAAAWPDSLVFHRLLRQLGVDEYIYWVASPRRSLLYGLHTDHLVYDCIDPAPETAGHNQLHATETWFAHRAKLVLCSAENLQQRLRQENPRCELVCNAAVASERAPANAQPLPPELANLRRPIAGVIGTVDFRIDYALLTAAAKRLPDITFLLIGHIAASGAGIAELRAQPNVVLAGEVARGPGYRLRGRLRRRSGPIPHGHPRRRDQPRENVYVPGERQTRRQHLDAGMPPARSPGDCHQWVGRFRRGHRAGNPYRLPGESRRPRGLRGGVTPGGSGRARRPRTCATPVWSWTNRPP